MPASIVHAARWVALSWLSLAAALSVQAATLVKDGQSLTLIALAPDADEHEKLAATELAAVLLRMSGATLAPPVVTEPAATDALLAEAKTKAQTVILLGRLAAPQLTKALGEHASVRGAFALEVRPGLILAYGPREGSYYAVYEMLEQLGCRWFMPGPLGEVIPELKTVTVKEQVTVQAPSFPSRWFQMPHKDWQMQVRCGGDAFAGSHGIKAPPYAKNKEGKYEPAENAEYYGLYKGQRVPRQHCISNPKLVAYMVEHIKTTRRATPERRVIGVGPNDGAGFCECEGCKALDAGDFDPFSGEASTTDRYIWFFNQILKGVNDEFPDTILAFYIYHTYMRPPKREKPDPRISGALAPIALDRVHGFSNPVAPEKSYARWLFQEWGKIMPELYDRGYWSNLACPGFVFNITDRLRDEIPACKEMGVKGWRVETFPNYGPQFPSMYVAAKLMWNHQTDVDALLADCYEKFFGPAAKPMGEYLTMMDHALRDGDYATGSSWDMMHFYPPALRARAKALLAEGEKLAGATGAYAERVKVINQSFVVTDAFCEMMEARIPVDFVAAKAALDRADAVAGELKAMTPVPMMSAGRFSTYDSYMKRFYRHATEQGYKRVTGDNKLVVALTDEWQFQIDPGKVGEDIGLWRADLSGGFWQKLKTSSQSWSNQGLRYYKGLAWYRQVVTVPEAFTGKRIFFWCGGVDETAKVWVNGQVIGISPGAAIYPFEMDATPALKPGRNVVVVCVSNQIVNELGTGGILAPVILYAPAAGADAKLENTRDLKPTFP